VRGAPQDRFLQLDTTMDGVGRLVGDLAPECAAAVTAALEALAKKRGPEDDRTAAQRFHDALQEGCELSRGSRGWDLCADCACTRRSAGGLGTVVLRGRHGAMSVAYSKVRHWRANSGHPWPCPAKTISSAATERGSRRYRDACRRRASSTSSG
jgi:hypothetical protein